MLKKIIIWILAVLIVAIVVWQTAELNNGGKKIKIGVVAPFSGPAAAFGDYVNEGLDQALSTFSEADRRQIEIIKEDDMCSGKSAILAVQKLIEVDKVKYVIGPLCNESSLATEKMFEDSGVISLSVGLPSNTIANMGKYHFSFAPEIEYLVKSIAQKMIDMNYKKVAIIHAVSSFEDENYKHFVKYYNLYGGTIVSDESVAKGSGDFRDAVLKIKKSNPDSVMIIAYAGDLNNILKQLASYDLAKIPKFGIHAAETPVLLQVKDLAEGLIYPYPADNSASENKFSVATAITYDSLKILKNTIDDCGYDNVDCVQKRLSGVKDYQGINGSLSVDDRGVGTYKEIMFKMVKNGEFVKIGTNGKPIQ